MANVKVKVATLFLVALLLCSTLIHASRPEPAFSNGSLPKNQQDQGVNQEEHAEMVEESCEGVGEEECLMRRTLAAHIDYIYTQKHKP
ncbi:phytosulfokines 3 [Ricinus communis]|uniref:Phytosulfokine n=1 Tax=Ricinus communis TaxID=3988 RepID=B9SH34_RICCO|nr:phytosulfokines 3 [Ricinus communis]EEF37131.1 phytosulfokines precursor, putative [Ricinus communis]|eukprot:XP_002525303.1 phytosulfokines 3 [Ricinus communis]